MDRAGGGRLRDVRRAGRSRGWDCGERVCEKGFVKQDLSIKYDNYDSIIYKHTKDPGIPACFRLSPWSN